MKKLIAVCLALILLTGCAQPVKEYDLSTEQTTTATTPEEETTVQREERTQRVYTTYPTTDSNRRYNSGTRVSYYDVDLRRSVTLCSQPNCKHSDEGCKAYLGQGQVSYTVVGDWVYALVDIHQDYSSCLLLKQNYITGERQIIADLTPKEGYRMQKPFISVKDGFMFYGYETYIYTPEEKSGYEYVDNRRFTYRYDFAKGESELLFEYPVQPRTWFVEMDLWTGLCTEKYWVVIKREMPETPWLSEEEYVEQGGKAEEWFDYIEAFEEKYPAKVYSVNLETGEETFLFIKWKAKMQDSACIREFGCSYVVDNTLCIYDTYTGEVRKCFNQENIGWQGYLDGRIFYNVHDGTEHTGDYRFYWYDLTTGEVQEFNRDYDTFAFGLDEETADYFYSRFGYNGKHWISKQDFYNENYENAF